MSSTGSVPESVDPLAAEEAAMSAREAGLLLAIEDAELEAAEVRAFASDVRTRLVRHAENRSEDVQQFVEDLDQLDLPTLSATSFDDRRRFLRVEALRARRDLVEKLDSELEFGHARIDAALDTVRRARDLMLRGRLRRPTPEATIVPQAGDSLTATVLAPAIELAPSSQASPTRTNARPVARPPLDDAPDPAPLRAGFRRKLETRIDFTSASNFFSGFSSNISDGGLFIATQVEMAIGTELEVALSLPDGVALRARCVVRWARPAQPDLPAGLGVEFVDLEGVARDAIHRFMRRRDPIFHEV